MLQRACLFVIVLGLAAGLAAGQTVEGNAVGDCFLKDIADARARLQAGASPWEDPAARPQPGPLAVLRGELPGGRIWAAFKPVDAAVRQAYWLQRQSYLEKDAGIRPRCVARELLPALTEAIRGERGAYNNTVISLAMRQVAQVDNALKHVEYHAALCILWGLADMLGLWDRQAALEVAEDHLGDMCQAGSKRGQISAKAAKRMDRKLEIIAAMVETAVAWKPIPESIGPAGDLPCDGPSGAARHFADAADLGSAFHDWRYNSVLDSGATPMVFDTTNARFALSFPAPETRCLYRAPQYRDWQDKLHDHRYGWERYENSAAQQKPECDWRNLEPWASWPGAKGINNAGGL